MEQKPRKKKEHFKVDNVNSKRHQFTDKERKKDEADRHTRGGF